MLVLVSIALGLLPSLAWLKLFLREDVRPHPNRLVVRAFLAGALVTLPVLFFGFLAQCVFRGCLFSLPEEARVIGPFVPQFSETVRTMLFFVLGIALVEEVSKFFAARFSVLRDPSFNEPVDAMLFLIVAALGFAAVENVAFALNASIQEQGVWGGVVPLLVMRFLSATLLHAIASGIVGYAVARALFDQAGKRRFILLGIAVATVVHGVYNGLLEGASPGDASPEAMGDFLVASGAVLMLLLGAGAVLWLMLQHLRALSRVHAWRNTYGNITLLR